MASHAMKMTAALPKEKQEEIAAVAYRFWLARAFRFGSPAEDWLRAERKILGKAGTVKLRRTTVGNFLVSLS